MNVEIKAQAAIGKVEEAVEESVLDMFGEEAAEEAPRDDMFRDMLVGMVLVGEDGLQDVEVAREACRMSLGYVPHELQERLGREDWLQ